MFTKIFNNKNCFDLFKLNRPLRLLYGSVTAKEKIFDWIFVRKYNSIRKWGNIESKKNHTQYFQLKLKKNNVNKSQ